MALHLTGSSSSATSTVDSFVANLPELLFAAAQNPTCVVAIAHFGDGRYIQFRVASLERFAAEVVSNRFITDGALLSASDERQLQDLGWSEPTEHGSPNWRRTGSSVPQLIGTVQSVRHVVYDVLRESPANSVRITTFEVAH